MEVKKRGVVHTNLNMKKLLTVLLWVAGIAFLVGAILIFAIAVPKADMTYKRVLGVICGILMVVLAGLCALYLWLSRDTYPNYFLFDRKRKKNIPVEKLRFHQVSERMTFLVSQIVDSPEDLWKSDVLLRGDETFGYRCVYKPLVAYKMLFDLGEQQVDSELWSYFRQAPASSFNALCETLERAGEKKMIEVFRVLVTREPKDNDKLKVFLLKNLPYIRSKMVHYVVRHVELFY